MAAHPTEQIIKHNGGLSIWEDHQFLRFRLRFGGLAFASRWNGKGKQERTVHLALHRQQAIFENYPGPGSLGVWTPDLLQLTAPDGAPFNTRPNPRTFFNTFRRRLWWDDLDLLYFAGYAAWNYFTMPYLLHWKGINILDIQPWPEKEEIWQKIEVGFPEHIATHSTQQFFYYDEKWRLRRHDYDPEVFASWARAAHYGLNHQVVQGVQIPATRRVVPRKPDGKTANFPVLVWIEAGGFEFLPSSQASIPNCLK